MEKGKIIILVGGSSAGKTSLGKALQERLLPETYLLLGIDIFWMSLPQPELDLDKVQPQYYSWEVEKRDGKDFFRIIPGPILDELMMGRYYAIAAYLERGFNVIADEVLWQPEWYAECLKALAGYDTTFVKVFCSDAEGSRRETARGDRHAGWNRGSAYYSDLYCKHYDFEIDTTNDAPGVCAEKLVAQLRTELGSRQ